MTTTPTASATLADLAGTYTIDPTHTRLGFVARHAMVTKVRGAFNEFDGQRASSTPPTPPGRRVDADHPGRQHRHPQRAARRPPAQQRLPRHGRATREITFVSTDVDPDRRRPAPSSPAT